MNVSKTVNKKHILRMDCSNFVIVLQYHFLNLITDDTHLMAHQKSVIVNDLTVQIVYLYLKKNRI